MDTSKGINNFFFFFLVHLLLLLSDLCNSHWINLHVWYEDPIATMPQADSPSQQQLNQLNNSNNASLLLMQQDSTYFVQATAESQLAQRDLPPCDQLDGLTQSQVDICHVFRDHMKAIVAGAKLGLSECRWQFRFNQWNCSSPPSVDEFLVNGESDTIVVVHPKNSSIGVGVVESVSAAGKKSKARLKSGKGNNGNGKKGKEVKRSRRSVELAMQFDSMWNSILKQGSKEVGFAHAVWSAAVTQTIARACREGSLSSCSCGKMPRPLDLKSEWRWGGCSDNLRYAYSFATDFIDSREKGAVDSKIRAKSLVNLHNNEAGRRAVLRKTKIVCKCHGVSGSCALVTCWHQIPSFREIGDHLKESYKDATLVKMNKRGRLQVKRAGVKVPSVHDLVYVETSPNYCVSNTSLGIFGVSGRICNRTSVGPDGCKQLCCASGFRTSVIRRNSRCNCKFVWCCSVICQECRQTHKISSCN